MIITLCGSSKFKEAFEKANHQLTLEGHLVFSLGCWSHHDGVTLTQEEVLLLSKIHFEKIALSDAIFVINVDNYIGQNTQLEILQAQKLMKQIFYLNA